MGDILMTGAAGQVGTMLRPYLRERFGSLVLSDIAEIDDLQNGETFRRADLSDSAALRAAMKGVSGVIHLGGQGIDADWNTVMERNIAGLQNTFDAASRVGVKRMVFASSVHAVGFYGRQRRIGVHDRVRPDSAYGVSKAFGEAVASLYADKYGMRCLSVRIGNVNPAPLDVRRLSIWIHPEDLAQLCIIAMEHPKLHNEVVFGASGNARSWWDNKPAYDLGYRPKHNAEDHLDRISESEPDPVGDLFQGGTFCSDGFDGDVERTLWD